MAHGTPGEISFVCSLRERVRSAPKKCVAKVLPPTGMTVMPLLVRLLFLFATLNSSAFAAQQAEAAWKSAVSAIPPEFTDIPSASGVRFKHFDSHTTKKYLIETMG